MSDFEDFEVDDTGFGDGEIEPDVFTEPRALPTPPRSQNMADGQRFEQRRFTGGDTLDESVLATILRDVKVFWRLLLQTVGFRPELAAKREWDLWGPLIFCLLISVVLSVHLGPAKSRTFSLVFALVWLGQATIASNIKLLGGQISYLHALSITGYSLFPLLLAAVFARLVALKLVRLPVAFAMVAWSAWSAQRGLAVAGVQTSRLALSVYPLILFYFALGWLCVLS